MKEPTDSEIIQWIACYVTEINSLEPKGRGERVELISEDGGELNITTRTGKTLTEAFRKCVTAAMRVFPKRL